MSKRPKTTRVRVLAPNINLPGKEDGETITPVVGSVISVPEEWVSGALKGKIRPVSEEPKAEEAPEPMTVESAAAFLMAAGYTVTPPKDEGKK